jgi:Nitrile hydratase beta subunit, C-terminal
MRFAAGDRVRARLGDPDHHTRVPRYVRGQVGEVVEAEGEWLVPDDSAQRVDRPRTETVYAVRFPAAALWGEGTHTVTLNLWESYLEGAG